MGSCYPSSTLEAYDTFQDEHFVDSKSILACVCGLMSDGLYIYLMLLCRYQFMICVFCANNMQTSYLQTNLRLITKQIFNQ